MNKDAWFRNIVLGNYIISAFLIFVVNEWLGLSLLLLVLLIVYIYNNTSLGAKWKIEKR